MTQEKPIKVAIAVIAITLVALIVFKPKINSAFHYVYSENLSNIGILTGELVKEHLNARHGHVAHYDYLEANLQALEKAGELMAITPEYLGDDFQKIAIAASESFLEDLSQIRSWGELSKRAIGLLRNSNLGLNEALNALGEEIISAPESKDKTALLAINMELNMSLRRGDNFEVVNALLRKLETMDMISERKITQIRLHAQTISDFERPLVKVSNNIYQKAPAMRQAEQLLTQYSKLYENVLQRNTLELWATYFLVAILIMLSFYQSHTNQRAKKAAVLATQDAEQARVATEDTLHQTREAVLSCTQVLERLSQGDFSMRVEESFTDDLNILKNGVNGTADSVQFTMQQLEHVMEAMQAGNFAHTMDPKVEGRFRTAVEKTNDTLSTAMNEICHILEAMRSGQFSNRIETPMSGSFDTVKHSVNQSLSFLDDSIRQISEVLAAQGDGDFSTRVDNQWPGELDRLGQSINSSAEQVSTVVSNIQELSHSLTQASMQMLKDADALKSQSDDQARSIEEALESSSVVSHMINANIESTHVALKLVTQSSEKTNSCMSKSVEATHAMQDIKSKTQEIGAKIQAIETIASKTNLLALNATVEAARAAEHGKGFSVVAGEVKALAKLSAEASGVINDIIRDTHVTVEQGSKLVTDTSDALEKINASIVDVQDTSKTVSSSSEEQLGNIQLVNEKVTIARRLAETNREMAESSHKASEELDELAKTMNSLVERFVVSSASQDIKRAA